MSKRTRVNRCAKEFTFTSSPSSDFVPMATFSTSCGALSFLKLILLHHHRLPNQTVSIGLGFEFLGRYRSPSYPGAACEDRQHENRRASFDRFLYRPTSFAGILHAAADGRSSGSLLKALWRPIAAGAAKKFRSAQTRSRDETRRTGFTTFRFEKNSS
jgi:hypothetical protein